MLWNVLLHTVIEFYEQITNPAPAEFRNVESSTALTVKHIHRLSGYSDINIRLVITLLLKLKLLTPGW
jgi:hypothetical protein